MTVIGALSSFRELGEMSPHKRASIQDFVSSLADLSVLILHCRVGELPMQARLLA